MTANSILTEMKSNGVGIITLNRPEVHNAFDEVMIQSLTEAIKQMEQDPLIRVILLQSAGKNFSAGADINWMKKMAHFSIDENVHDAGLLSILMSTLYNCQKPTVAKVQGAAFGGGVGLVACCQIVIAASNATFCFSEVKLGLIPATISPYVIQAIGLRQARAYFLSAQPFHASEAKAMGLCHEVVALEELENRTHEVIHGLLRNGPQALKVVNALLNKLPVTPEIINLTVQKLVEVRTSKEGQEGLSAFLEKRSPNWIQN
jgi:methylglutaconyl-CoA hydratase